ncbi:MAG: UBP-type zinc finger domain-containing protein [Mucilaginibacter sp.]|nr:UBP-type zinc finger domain-containing protein [Mucilaginibacter sp.]
MGNSNLCTHLKAIKDIKIGQDGVCEECIKINSTWVHLRTCQTCGVTLCCDQSPMRHMTKHYHASKHPVVASAQPDERWLWCYPDELFANY